MAALARVTGFLTYRLRLGPLPSTVPDHRLAEVVDGADRVPPGRALDLGTGIGRNAHYLARHGWDTTGVEAAGSGLARARQVADRDGLAVRFVQGDVTRLTELDLGGQFNLLMDGGCLHMIPPTQRPGYVNGVSAVAAPGALLIIVGFTRRWAAIRVSRDEIERLFTGWTLLTADPVPGQQMCQYVAGPRWIRLALRHNVFRPWRYQLRYQEAAEQLFGGDHA